MRFRCLGSVSFSICAILLLALSQGAKASTLCVDHSGAAGCYKTIGLAVSHAQVGDVIVVRPGTYDEDVIIGTPLSLIGSGADRTIIDAAGQPNGVFIDGYTNGNMGVSHVTLSGFTVKNATWEGVLVVSADDVTIRANKIIDNDKAPTSFTQGPGACDGQPMFETDESGDCGGGLHLMGVSDSVVSGNTVSGNSDGILVTDETGPSHDILITQNAVLDNPGECGIVLASHPPVGAIGSPHNGLYHITVAENDSENNGIQVNGAGVGIFSDGIGPGRNSEEVVIDNRLIGNGNGGVALHTHAGPSFGASADDMEGNQIIGNYISKNLADANDTATPGRVGININSGAGGSPVLGTVVTRNVITDEDVDVAVNTPAEVDVHGNDLLGGKIGVANICSYDKAACAGSVSATENYFGCAFGPGAQRCTTATGPNVVFDPWLSAPVIGNN